MYVCVYIYIYIYVHMYVCVCVNMCLCLLVSILVSIYVSHINVYKKSIKQVFVFLSFRLLPRGKIRVFEKSDIVW